jgi:hypothetical protein
MTRIASLALATALLAGALGCAAPQGLTADIAVARGPHDVALHVSRSEGMLERHFSSKVSLSAWDRNGSAMSWFTTPEVQLHGELPPGLAFDPHTLMISGTPHRSGSWTVELYYRDYFNDDAADGWWSEQLEIRIHDELVEG